MEKKKFAINFNQVDDIEVALAVVSVNKLVVATVYTCIIQCILIMLILQFSESIYKNKCLCELIWLCYIRYVSESKPPTISDYQKSDECEFS
jgi:hypothetical protein